MDSLTPIFKDAASAGPAGARPRVSSFAARVAALAACALLSVVLVSVVVSRSTARAALRKGGLRGPAAPAVAPAPLLGAGTAHQAGAACSFYSGCIYGHDCTACAQCLNSCSATEVKNCRLIYFTYCAF